MDSGFQVLGSGFSFKDSRFLQLYSGFQIPKFRIPQAKIYRFRIPLHGAKLEDSGNYSAPINVKPQGEGGGGGGQTQGNLTF